jgi:hypothetical protein
VFELRGDHVITVFDHAADRLIQSVRGVVSENETIGIIGATKKLG